MLIEQPPVLYRLLFQKSFWRIPKPGQKTVYLTFDDGPIPEITPWVLQLLDQHQIKATFFCVGENVQRHPEIFEQLRARGHQVGNHTHNHLQGWKTTTRRFLENTHTAHTLIQSPLFRPPHGHVRIPQTWKLRARGYKIIMWDVVTRDYSRICTPQQVLNNVQRYTRDGSIIVFHDSLKAERNLRYALPRAIEWLKKEGYRFEVLTGKEEL